MSPKPPLSAREISPQQVERLCQKTSCTPEIAQEVLAEQQGSLLSAFLALEQMGQVPIPEHPSQGFFSTKDQHNLTFDALLPRESPEDTWSFHGFTQFLKRELVINHLELWYKDKYWRRLPVYVLLLLFPLTYGSLLPILTLPLFLGVHYRFSQEGSFLSEFNPVLRRTTKTLTDLRLNIKSKFRPQKKQKK